MAIVNNAKQFELQFELNSDVQMLLVPNNERREKLLSEDGNTTRLNTLNCLAMPERKLSEAFGKLAEKSSVSQTTETLN